MSFRFDYLLEITFLASLWWTSIGLAVLSLVTMVGLILRRIHFERYAAVLAERKKALTHLVMIYLDFPINDSRIKETCRNLDMHLLLSVASGLVESKRFTKNLRIDLNLLSDIVQDLLGSVRGTDREQVINLLRETPAEKMFIADLRSKHVGTRIKAIEALTLLPGPEVIEALRGRLADRNPDVRFAAARAMVEMGHYVTVDDLVEKLDIGNAIRSRALRDTFRVLASQNTDDLVRLLDSKPPDLITELALYAIGSTQDFSMIPVITRHASWPSVDVRCEALRALAAIGHPAAEPTVLAGLRDESWEVRKEAAICAGTIQLPNAIPLLRANLEDPEWWPRFRAAEALNAIGGEGIKALEDTRRGTGNGAKISDMILAEVTLAA